MKGVQHMQREPNKHVKDALAENHRHKIWLRVAGALMAVVVFCTTYALILPAITESHRTYCGLEEHTHDQNCYEAQEVPKVTYTCDPAAQADFVIHLHDANCYDTAGNLLCTLDQREGHTHGDACYTEAKTLTCQQTEQQGHTHTASCYSQTRGDLTCTQDHDHTDDCYQWTQNLICGQEEQPAGHVHDDACYTVTKTLTCDKVEVQEHLHDYTCYVRETKTQDGETEWVPLEETDTIQETDMLTCCQAQILAHQHTAACLTEDPTITETRQVLTCGLEEHSHTDQCFQAPESLQFTYEDEDVSGIITLPWDDDLPDDLSCTVVKLDGTEADYAALYDSAEAAVSSDTQELSEVVFYQLEWYSGGAAYTLPEDLVPTIELTLPESETGETVYGLSLAEMETEIPQTASEPQTQAVEVEETENSTTVHYTAQRLRAAATSQEQTLGADDSATYTAEAAPSEDGTTTVQTRRTFAIAKARAAASQAGAYYVRVDGTSELLTGTSYDYLFVFANGSKSLRGTDTWYTDDVSIQPVDGNSKYFTITDVSTGYAISPTNYSNKYKNRHWNITINTTYPSGAYYVYENKNTNDELYFGSVGSYDNQIRFTYNSAQKTWLISGYNKNLYLCNENGSTVSQVEASQALGDSNILIFRYVGGSLNVGNNITEAASLTASEDLITTATKPTYGAYRTNSSAKEGTGALLGLELSYKSDPSTAKIEETLGMTSSGKTGTELYAAQKQNDGRVVTDKSVVYGDDDYDAISDKDYEAGDFSVTLSALGQEWAVSTVTSTTSPVDVVFLLDLSGTMGNATVTDGTEPRWYAALIAINKAMYAILSQNENNRVGLVVFSNIAVEVMPLGHYTAAYDASISSNIYLTITGNGPQYIQTSSALKKDGKAFNVVSLSDYVGKGLFKQTNIQVGLQQVYETFANADTTVDVTAGTQTVTLTRQPVTIFLSDGDPTVGTYNYMDPSAGPFYGYGVPEGSLGYYSILSANYFKNMTSIHYGVTEKFYTVGMGINETGYGVSANSSYTDAYFSDAYRRAVLYPSSGNISALNVSWNSTIAGQQETWEDTATVLYSWLSGTATVSTMQGITLSGNLDGTGYSAGYLRYMANPYSNYNYVDGAYFGNIDGEQLQSILTEIQGKIQFVNNYNFLLAANTSLVITDPIGEGMEVKGTPVLRYFGVNLTNPTVTTGTDYTEYTWNVTVDRQESDVKTGDDAKVDLSKVTAKVTTGTDGTQTVTFTIPENAVPTFYPDIHKTFYYEELPIRLIYRVGLSETEKTAISAALKNGETVTKTYYTNQWNTDGTAYTTASFVPATSNPYYKSTTTNTVNKTTNTTGTASYVFQEGVTGSFVSQTLGNNGKISLAKMTGLTITKQWDSSVTERQPVTVWLYRQKHYDSGTVGTTIDYVGAYYLNSANSWTQKLTDLTEDGTDENGGHYVWQYYVTESLNNLDYYNAYYTDAEGNEIGYDIYSAYIPSEYKTFSYVRLYPVSGLVTISNRAALEVQKVWSGDGSMPDSIVVDVYRTSTPINSNLAPMTQYVTTLTLKGDSWFASYKPNKFQGFGLEFNGSLAFVQCYFDYYLVERPVEGYTAAYSYENGTALSAVQLTVGTETVAAYPASQDVTITNTAEANTSITVKKTWAEGATPEPVQVILFARTRIVNLDTGAATSSRYVMLSATGKMYEYYTETGVVTLNEENGWEYTWSSLPVETEYDGSKMELEYFIYEVDTGKYIPTYLNQSGQEIETKKWTPTNDNEDGKVGFIKGLMKYVGTETICVAPVTFGTTTIYNSPKTLTLTKTWAGGAGDTESVTVEVYRKKVKSSWNGTALPLDETDEHYTSEYAKVTETWEPYETVTLTKANNWTATIPIQDICAESIGENGSVTYTEIADIVNIPYDDNDQNNLASMVFYYRYDYYIVEQSVEGYTATYIDPDTGAALEPEAMPVEDAAEEADASMEESTTKTLAVYPATGSVAIKNTRTYVMPSTGGTGTRRYTMGGAAIVLTASALYILSRRRRLQRGRGGEI
jgi:hypothetical protein